MFESIEQRYSPARSSIDPAHLPQVIYHYTDAAGLAGMLSSGRIWATQYRFLNDRSEVDHTRALVRSVILARMKERNRARMGVLYSRILDQIERPDDETEIYVFSLSAEKDSLSQWRGYAHDGRGFTIGFDAREFTESSEGKEISYGFCRVEYDEDRQIKGLVSALQAIEREGERLVAATGGKAEIDRIWEEAASSFDVIMCNRAVANKHSSFASENEWRVFSFCEGEERSKCRARARATGLVPYVEFSADELCSRTLLPIAEIGIGPGFPDKGQLRAVQVLARQYGYNPEIYLANAPYRAG